MRKSLTLSLTWVLTAVVFLITGENIWLDPWLRLHYPTFPSLAPEPPSLLWILTFAAIGVVCAVLIVGQVLLMRRPGVPRRSKIIAGTLVVAALSLSVLWFCVTSGIASVPHALLLRTSHTVKLTWNASTTPGVTYNVYRINNSTGTTEKLNTDPITELTFTDKQVVNGESYTYFAKAVLGTTESAQSNLAPATIPPS